MPTKGWYILSVSTGRVENSLCILFTCRCST